MTTKHTPGPWRINPGTVEIRGADWNDIVADAGLDADAHLIAAAPDLLAACEALARSFDAVAYAAWTPEMHAAVAAIAKAKGETK